MEKICSSMRYYGKIWSSMKEVYDGCIQIIGYTFFRDMGIMKYIKLTSLKWAGHLMKMTG